jgi:uncharacterized protein DUF4410
MRMAARIRYQVLIIGCLLLTACANVKVTGRHQLAAVPEITPGTIYVSDFSLDPQSIRLETGLLPVSPLVSAQSDESETLFPRLVGMPTERTVRARELVQLMTVSIVEDLRDLGLNASRLSAGYAPSGGWLVHGAFVYTDEGNRISRALVGFGKGKTELEMLFWLNDLQSGAGRPFCELGTNARSSRGPGAITSIDPFEALGRFMTGGLDLDRNVMETARRIAREIAQTIQHHNCTA